MQKQEEDEALIECTKQFEQAQENVKSIVGIEWLDKFMESAEECLNETDTDTKEELDKMSFESFVACAFLRNCTS